MPERKSVILGPEYDCPLCGNKIAIADLQTDKHPCAWTAAQWYDRFPKTFPKSEPPTKPKAKGA